jgi:hypothetical protein
MAAASDKSITAKSYRKTERALVFCRHVLALIVCRIAISGGGDVFQ